MTVIACFDLASSTGICVGRPNATPRAYAIKAPVTGQDYGAYGIFFLRHFDRLLRELIAQLEPDEKLLLAYESPLLPVARWSKKEGKMMGGTTIQTTRKLHFLGPLLETVAEMLRDETGANIDIREASVSAIKKELGGSGNAAKSAMVFVARRAGIALPDGPEAMDAADAFGLFALCVRLHCPEWSRAWDARLFSGSGIGIF